MEFNASNTDVYSFWLYFVAYLTGHGKTHVLSIFGKLDVSSRMLAVQEGRAKGLIQ